MTQAQPRIDEHPNLDRIASTRSSGEPPRLAASVKLLGQMSGTGFEQQPWLIEYESQFVQVSDLLYRVVEKIDGHRTIDEVAAEVTASSKWSITGEQVGQLIDAKLKPLGLVVDPSSETRQHAGSSVHTSPLAVQMKLKTIGPAILNPIARFFQFLFHPAIVLPMVLIMIAAHWWLYRVHGLSDSLAAALNTPGGLLLVIGILFASGFWHELGHASALTYGGGYVRGMGIGLYLIYPAFYTDVTDGYRLGRWARVRVDLGGVYFHAIASLALIGIGIFVPGAELVLISVVLINIEIARQFIPFVKMDGYWLLADLTGIPDFFSQMGPFLRSLAPAASRHNQGFAQLKQWVKVVFATYIVAVIPALTYLVFVMLKHLPNFIDQTARTIVRQASILPVVWQNGDFITVALLSLTVVLLAASVAGSFLILALTILPPLTMAWKWTQGITRRVVPVAGATAVFAGSIGFLWYPDATRIYQRLSAPAPSRIALELFEQAAVATAKVSSVRADVEGAIGPELYNGSITLKRPNLAHITISGEGGLGTFQVISDGNKLHTFFPADNSFVASGPGKHGEYVNAYVADQIAFFFQPDSIKAAMKKGKAAHAGTLPLDGETYDLVDQSLDDGRNTTLRYFIAQSDHMIHGVSTSRAGETLKWSRLKRVKRDAALDSATFAWTPPQDASTAGLPSGLNLPIGPMK